MPARLKAQANNWTPVTTGCLNGPVAVFDFAADFNYSEFYDIVVVPEYNAPPLSGAGNDATAIPTPLGIHVTGDFYFNGIMDISGDNGDPLHLPASAKARCRRPPRPKERNYIAGDFGLKNLLATIIRRWNLRPDVRRNGRIGTVFQPLLTLILNTKIQYPNKPGGYDVFGPGASKTAPYKDSGGAGHGGRGGDSGRGYALLYFSGGAVYGDKEVPVPFWRSASSWAMQAGGCAGGGGAEIIATGNVTFRT